jgi:hypothetical protein
MIRDPEIRVFSFIRVYQCLSVVKFFPGCAFPPFRSLLQFAPNLVSSLRSSASLSVSAVSLNRLIAVAETLTSLMRDLHFDVLAMPVHSW